MTAALSYMQAQIKNGKTSMSVKLLLCLLLYQRHLR